MSISHKKDHLADSLTEAAIHNLQRLTSNLQIHINNGTPCACSMAYSCHISSSPL